MAEFKICHEIECLGPVSVGGKKIVHEGYCCMSCTYIVMYPNVLKLIMYIVMVNEQVSFHICKGCIKRGIKTYSMSARGRPGWM